MKQYYALHDKWNGYLGNITRKELIDGVKYNLITTVSIGERYEYNGGLLYHFKRDLKQKRAEAKEDIKEKCWECGEVVDTTDNHRRVYCNECNKKRVENLENVKQEYRRLGNLLKIEKAVKMLESQEKKVKMKDYKDAIAAVEEYLQNNPNKFDSTEEVVAAIELVKNRVEVKVCAEVAGFRFDFMLKEEQVLLEIDGERHKYKLSEDANRDLLAVQELGAGWEVVRVPTAYIASNIKQLIPYIRQVYDQQQKLREKNNGVLPYYNSPREKALYEEKAKTIKM